MMFSKIKYVLFDYSDNFKNNFWSLFSKTIPLIIIGIIMCALGDVNNLLPSIGAIAFFISGFMWGREVIGLITPPSFLKTPLIRLFWTIFSFALSIVVGVVYFIWCVVKIVIYYIKRNVKTVAKND